MAMESSTGVCILQTFESSVKKVPLIVFKKKNMESKTVQKTSG